MSLAFDWLLSIDSNTFTTRILNCRPDWAVLK